MQMEGWSNGHAASVTMGTRDLPTGSNVFRTRPSSVDVAREEITLETALHVLTRTVILAHSFGPSVTAVSQDM